MESYTTGIAGLDEVFNGLLPGDNLVFEVDDIEDYRLFVRSFVEAAKERGKEIVYFRFADHPSLLEEKVDDHVRIVPLDPRRGFEYFVSDLIQVVEDSSAVAWFVFDCLSGLVQDW
jgi:hypothetical protein